MRLTLKWLAFYIIAVMTLLPLTSDGGTIDQMDPSSAVRGSLGVSLFDLSFDKTLGAISFFLNAGFALLWAAGVICLLARTRRDRHAKSPRPAHRERAGLSQSSFPRQ